MKYHPCDLIPKHINTMKDLLSMHGYSADEPHTCQGMTGYNVKLTNVTFTDNRCYE